LAIHDTSSVVGAAAKYGTMAVAIAMTVKLARALWIVPVSLGTAMFRKSSAKIQWPWVIAFFCMAAMLNTYLPSGANYFSSLFRFGKIGLTVTLFLIGASVSKQTLKLAGGPCPAPRDAPWLRRSYLRYPRLCAGIER
jgi:uncharacterized membrane protein YadS